MGQTPKQKILTLKRILGGKFHDFELGNGLLAITIKTYTTKEKKLGFI